MVCNEIVASPRTTRGLPPPNSPCFCQAHDKLLYPYMCNMHYHKIAFSLYCVDHFS